MSLTREKLLGSNKWKGLLEPELNLSLRKFILRCGNLCEATYDCFNSNVLSRNCGNSRCGKETFLHDVVLEEASYYQVVAFLYATSGIGDPTDNVFFQPGPAVREAWDRQSNWMGYVAVTTDEVSRGNGFREVYVAWRGTVTSSEWYTNIFNLSLESSERLFSPYCREVHGGEPKVHGGWLSIYTSMNKDSIHTKQSARQQLRDVINQIRKTYTNEKLSVVVTGHSLGGALATLSAFDLAEHKVAGEDVLVSDFVFGCPQVGNEDFKKLVNDHSNLKILHIRNKKDIIPGLPDGDQSIYVPTQTAELVVDSDKSQHLKLKSYFSLTEMKGNWHNLEATLHLVAWWNGKDNEFDNAPKADRSLALVNKWCNYLNDDYKIPESWWIEKNKGMMFDQITGDWILDPPTTPRADRN